MSNVTAIRQSVHTTKPPGLPPVPGQVPGQWEPVQLPAQRSSLVTTMLRNAAVFGAIGAVAGAALSFTALPFVGALTAPIAAAIGGAAGVAFGIVKGIFQHRRENDSPVGQLPLPPSTPPGSLIPPPLPPGVRR